MKIKPFKTRFLVPIYECYLTLKVTEDVQAEWEKNPEPSNRDDADSYCQAFYVSNWPEFMIVVSPTASHDDLTHEVGHVCRSIMGEIGFRVEHNNDEPLAYLEGWMMQQVRDRMDGEIARRKGKKLVDKMRKRA